MEVMMSDIAVLIPCYNEEKTISQVIDDCKNYLPNANIYVYDNNSNDKTVEYAIKQGAIVRYENRQGKGNVVRRMFADIDADIYVMIDGDATYDVSSIPNLIKILEDENLDMVVGVRQEIEQSCYRVGHRSGNKVLTKIVEIFLNYKLKDMLSGLRVFSKRYVKTFPAESKGFEIETELTIYALSRRLPIKEVETKYFSRPEGSFSKLSTYKDGGRILKTIALLIKEERPLLFFSLVAFVIFVVGLSISVPIFIEFKQTGLVPRFPTAILASGLMVCSFVSFFIGIVLDTVVKAKKEISRINYLKYKNNKK
ncbi:MAG: glycosyltransferase [Alphaproteobacteria bacterium]|nr:glycosyltransferase [Alphaproteobacteria bacterium]